MKHLSILVFSILISGFEIYTSSEKMEFVIKNPLVAIISFFGMSYLFHRKSIEK